MNRQLEQLPIFVYGTLQRGEQRSSRWPCRPRTVRWATTQGALYDLGDYPALIDGTDCVLGELCEFRAADLAETLRTLDAVEGFLGRDDDLYARRVVECVPLDGSAALWAYSYFYARLDELAEAIRLSADSRGLVHWRRLNTEPPKLS